MTIFVKEGTLYRKFEETHYQRGYTIEEMTEFVEKAGLLVKEVLDATTHKAATKTSERVYIIAQECQK